MNKMATIINVVELKDFIATRSGEHSCTNKAIRQILKIRNIISPWADDNGEQFQVFCENNTVQNHFIINFFYLNISNHVASNFNTLYYLLPAI